MEELRRGAGIRIVCIEGARACPPEDCGGPFGYEELCAILGNPKHPDDDQVICGTLSSGGTESIFLAVKAARDIMLKRRPGIGRPQMVLAASASYIAVPAVVRYAIPEANPSLYVGLSLGLTFPLNILLGISGYTQVAAWVLG